MLITCYVWNYKIFKNVKRFIAGLGASVISHLVEFGESLHKLKVVMHSVSIALKIFTTFDPVITFLRMYLKKTTCYKKKKTPLLISLS